MELPEHRFNKESYVSNLMPHIGKEVEVLGVGVGILCYIRGGLAWVQFESALLSYEIGIIKPTHEAQDCSKMH